MVETYNATLHFSDAVANLISARCIEGQSGARTIDHMLSNTIMPALSAEVLERVAARESFARIEVDLDLAGGFAYHLF
jgi:type VI secretion system protein VasG